MSALRPDMPPRRAAPNYVAGNASSAPALCPIHEALQKLEQADPRRAELVMLRYFAALSIDETAAALGVSPRTVDTEWRFARAWLHRELSKGDSTWCGRAGSDDD